MQINAYLNFNGNCNEAFNFYAHALGGKIVAMVKFEETPMKNHVAPEWLGKIVHARLTAGGNVLMGSDGMQEHFEKPQGFSVTINVEEPAEADRIFQVLAEGGNIGMPIQETFWAKRFGMVVDRFGTPWMVNCEKVPM